jgi:hypothetical protein
VGERNSNLKTEGLDSISKKALDLMIEDKKEEENESRTHSTEYTTRYCPKCYVYNAIID